MDFTVLKYFQAVARNGNMTKTARELYYAAKSQQTYCAAGGRNRCAVV